MSQIEPFLDMPIKRRKKRSKLRRGLMQSYFLFVSVAVIFGLGVFFWSNWRIYNGGFNLIAFILLVVGVFRLAYAVFFESELLGRHEDPLNIEIISNRDARQLDGRSSVSIKDTFHPSGATTNELKPLVDTVTDPTTKNLKRED
jgi:hypothetical protein